MGRVVRFAAPRRLEVVDEHLLPLEPGQVRLRTLFSGISSGTELTAYRGSNPYLAKRWDSERRLFVAETVSLEYPVDGWGYEEVGEIVELGSAAEGVHVGEIVYGDWGHRSHHVAEASWAAERTLPEGVDPLIGVFSRIGAIALNAVIDADIHVGEQVAVFGQGVPGLLVTQLARLNGGEVIAVDGIDSRLRLARTLGATVVDFRTGSAAETIKALTEGRGADVSIEISGSYDALAEAIRATAYNSRVIAAGFFQGGGAPLFLGEEFHHNRVDVVCSQISGLSPRVDHRWDLRRLERTVLSLAADGRLDVASLVTHRIPVEQAGEAFELVDRRPGECAQVVLSFGRG
jgi:2-desacetyl-2-hydroxyethyl bacteriochlorophyllide A dehydrogenase